MEKAIATITNISEVDASGNFIVTYLIHTPFGTYPNLQTTVRSRNEATQNIKQVMETLQASLFEQQAMEVGEEISL